RGKLVKSPDAADAKARWNRWIRKTHARSPRDEEALARSLAYEEDLARGLGYLGDLYINKLNSPVRAEGVYEKSHRIRERLYTKGKKPPRFCFQLARSWQNRGKLAWTKYDLYTAIKMFQKAEELQVQLVNKFSQVREYKGDLQETYNTLAEWTIHLGHR